jgi:hypothetical protein
MKNRGRRKGWRPPSAGSIALLLSLLAGCGPAASYPYRTAEGSAEEFRARDRSIEYRIRAHYTMRDGVTTGIEIEFRNGAGDTLSLDFASVKVDSRNIAYQYNAKFVPLPRLLIPPHHVDHVTLTGREVGGEDDWLKIAGERLTVTIKGLRLGGEELAPLEAAFVPVNPKLGR